eukprot:9060762-Lingulodinium_polyedra.AAC.1
MPPRPGPPPPGWLGAPGPGVGPAVAAWATGPAALPLGPPAHAPRVRSCGRAPPAGSAWGLF